MIRLLLLCLLFLSQQCKADWFISSKGSDSNSGTNQAQAWKTWAKLVSVTGLPNGHTIFIEGDTELRESVELGNFNILTSYGGGPRPLINGADIATNWSKACPYTNVWCITNWVISGGGSATFIPVIENGVQLVRLDSISKVETNPGSYFGPYDPPAGSTNAIYIHTRQSTDPNTDGRVYEIGRRNRALYFGDYNQIGYLRTRNQIGNNGSVEGHLNNNVKWVLAENGTKHNFFIASGIVENCVARYQEYGGLSATLFIHYDLQDGLRIEYKNCIAAGSPNKVALATAYYGHTSSAGYGRVIYESCRAEFTLSFGTPGIRENGLATYKDCVSWGNRFGGWLVYAGTNEFINCTVLASPWAPGSPGARAIDSGSQSNLVWISGCKFSDYGISAQATGSRIVVVDSIISASTAFMTIGAISNATFSVSNSIVDGPWPYSLTVGNTMTSVSNVYPRFISSQVNGITSLSWGIFKVLDTGSLTNAMQWIGDVKRGNYEYLPTSPAVSVLAGPGWRTPPRPDNVEP